MGEVERIGARHEAVEKRQMINESKQYNQKVWQKTQPSKTGEDAGRKSIGKKKKNNNRQCSKMQPLISSSLCPISTSAMSKRSVRSASPSPSAATSSAPTPQNHSLLPATISSSTTTAANPLSFSAASTPKPFFFRRLFLILHTTTARDHPPNRPTMPTPRTPAPKATKKVELRNDKRNPTRYAEPAD
eukprot:TRINITY_DN6956_c1_g1_i2.p2 TRINITY_DN6956_c1_g1~~TRINITY_DN6956_c1_g1_i2.p2  ORF type:complete len:188 (-),score=21.78 TRINITY_DN6956_c1_g1_i2:765-1328(-)